MKKHNAFILAAALGAAALSPASTSAKETEHESSTHPVAVDAQTEKSTWKREARLLETQALGLLETDEERTLSLARAGRMYHAAGDLRKAEAALLRAATEALANGSVVVAAHAFLDAALVAKERGSASRALAHLRNGARLADSPHLSADERHGIQRRIA